MYKQDVDSPASSDGYARAELHGMSLPVGELPAEEKKAAVVEKSEVKVTSPSSSSEVSTGDGFMKRVELGVGDVIDDGECDGGGREERRLSELPGSGVVGEKGGMS